MSKHPAVKKRNANASAPAFASLADFCPDLGEWPQRWCFDDGDLEPGQRILAALEPYLRDLLARGLSRKTLHNHRDNLWLLGGELIRRLHDEPALRRRPVADLLDRFLEEDGGPLIYPRISETAQRSFDRTCAKLYAFIRVPKANP